MRYATTVSCMRMARIVARAVAWARWGWCVCMDVWGVDVGGHARGMLYIAIVDGWASKLATGPRSHGFRRSYPAYRTDGSTLVLARTLSGLYPSDLLLLLITLCGLSAAPRNHCPSKTWRGPVCFSQMRREALGRNALLTISFSVSNTSWQDRNALRYAKR